MGREKKTLGFVGEGEACIYLERHDYRIEAKNLRTPFGELDIVARHKRFLVFIEVKTRIGSSLGPPCLSVTWKKKKSLVKNALWYLKRYGLVYTLWRIDVVSVKLNTKNEVENIEIIENAVENDDY